MTTEVNRRRVEALREEFDLLCLGAPTPWRIAQALGEGTA